MPLSTPLWRRFPPVYAPLRLRALLTAAGAVRGERAAAARARATAALEAHYPGYTVHLVNSGTSALALALQQVAASTAGGTTPAAQLRRTGRPVVALPAYACPDLGSAAIGANMGVRLYDVNPRTLQPEWDSLEAQLQAGATHVVAAHLFGRLVDVPRVQAMAARHGATVVEDAAQHAGGTLAGVRGGALAPISILSFGRGKGLNAGGGGALLLARAGAPSATPAEHEERIAPDIHEPDDTSGAAALAVAMAAECLSRPLLYRVPSAIPALRLGATEYHPPTAAARLAGTNAALLTETLRTEPHVLAARRTVEAWYRTTLPAECQYEPVEGCTGGALRFPIRLGGELAGELAEQLAPMGVARSYPRTLAEYPVIANRLLDRSPTPGATELAATLHTLPTHALLTNRDREALVNRLLQRLPGGAARTT